MCASHSPPPCSCHRLSRPFPFRASTHCAKLCKPRANNSLLFLFITNCPFQQPLSFDTLTNAPGGVPLLPPLRRLLHTQESPQPLSSHALTSQLADTPGWGSPLATRPSVKTTPSPHGSAYSAPPRYPFALVGRRCPPAFCSEPVQSGPPVRKARDIGRTHDRLQGRRRGQDGKQRQVARLVGGKRRQADGSRREENPTVGEPGHASGALSQELLRRGPWDSRT